VCVCGTICVCVCGTIRPMFKTSNNEAVQDMAVVPTPLCGSENLC
jgi:hypothetical protein